MEIEIKLKVDIEGPRYGRFRLRNTLHVAMRLVATLPTGSSTLLKCWDEWLVGSTGHGDYE